MADLEGATVLEIGTGGQPLLPILFSLAGCTVYMTDLHRLIRPDTFNAALSAIGACECSRTPSIIQRANAWSWKNVLRRCI